MLLADNTIVVMIDFQDKLIKATNAEIEAQNALKMIKSAKILDIPTIVSEQYPKGLGNTASFISENFDENVKIIEKTSFSLLKEQNTLDILNSYDRKQVILFGIETHICVLQTALDLLKNGFEVFLLANASKSRQEYEHSVGCELLKSEGAKIITLEIALFQLLSTSKHQNFKEIQSLIK